MIASNRNNRAGQTSHLIDRQAMRVNVDSVINAAQAAQFPAGTRKIG